MDPNAVLRRWTNAVAARDIDEALDAASALGTWMSRGGFAPEWGQGGLPTERDYHATNTRLRDLADGDPDY